MRSERALAAAALLVAGCFSFAPPDGAFVCNPGPEQCPPGYLCAADNTCRREALDLAVDADGAADLAGPPVDLATSDLGGAACPSFALFCDDFESGTTNRWPTVVINTGTSLKVGTTSPHTGTRSLESDVPTGLIASAEADVQKQFVSPGAVLAVRAYVQNKTDLTGYAGPLLLRNSTSMSYLLVGGDSMGHWVLSEGVGTTLNDSHATSQTPPPGSWSCVEVVVTQLTGKATFQLFIDGAAVIDAGAVDTAPAYDTLVVGVARGGNGYGSFVDDVAIAGQRIGCF